MTMKHKKTEPLVSVILPVYNVQKYLGKCLDSVLNNSYKNLEIICVNDGSKDKCAEILEHYKEKDSRIKIITQENQGVSVARNEGLQAAKGEFIAFMDSDDYIHPRFFKSMMACMLEKNADLVVCNALRVNEDTPVSEEKYTQIHYKRINGNRFFKNYYARHMVWARIYRKEDLRGRQFSTEVHMSEDTFFNLEVVLSIRNPVVYETKTPLYYYLQRADSIVHTADYLNLKEAFDHYQKHTQWKQEPRGKWFWMLPLQVVKSMLSYRYMVRFRPDAGHLRKEANQALRTYLKIVTFSNVSVIEKIKHWVIYFCPRLYRVYRILNDPTMLKWEREEKELEQTSAQSSSFSKNL